MIGDFVIVRSRDQGVVCGVLRAAAGRAVELDDARQIHGWTNATGAGWRRRINTLFEMARYGAGNARISEPAPKGILILDVCGVIPCTPEAEENLRQSRWNEFYDASRSSPPATTPGGSSRPTRSRKVAVS